MSYFYENGQGFHFRSIDSFLYGKVRDFSIMFEYFADSETARGLTIRDNYVTNEVVSHLR